jgi:hypothetical protein
MIGCWPSRVAIQAKYQKHIFKLLSDQQQCIKSKQSKYLRNPAQIVPFRDQED